MSSRRFFTVVARAFQLRDLIGEGAELFGQAVEGAEVVNLLLDCLGLGGRNAFGTLLTVQGALEDEVRARLEGLAMTLGFEELAVQ